MTNWQKWVVVSVVLVMTAATTFVAGFGIGHYVVQPRQALLAGTAEEHQSQFEIFWEAWRVIEDRFYTEEPLDPERMTYGAIRGMVASLGDPHTVFLEPAQADMFRADLEGEFSGIGATVTMSEEGYVRVTKPLPGSPAEEAGLRSGDLIIEVDGHPVQGLGLIQAILLIRGEEGTEVHLLVERIDDGPAEVTIQRAVITVPATEARMLQEGIGYLAIYECTARAPAEVRDALRQLLADGVRALILDLRGNPGGYLHVAKEITSEFLDGGLVLIERGIDGKETRHEASSGGLATQIPMVVLVDGGSASAAEIIAGAMQDRSRGILVGEQTFGKGSVQINQRLSDGSALQITIRRWYTPNDRQIQGEGLSPDIPVERSEEDLRAGRDPQLDRALSSVMSFVTQ